MTPLFYHVLLSLADAPGHGYALLQEIEARAGVTLRGPSSLYYALGRLEDAGLIRPVDTPAGADDPHEERRRYYAITASGRERLRDETRVLSDIVEHARARGILP
jgi:DNA-binding PadR family transcriptional regulator